MQVMTNALLALLSERSFKQGEFKLSSGRTSDFFIDCKPVMLSADGHRLLGSLLYNVVLSCGPIVPVAVAGVELGGCALASAVSTVSTSLMGSRHATLKLGTAKLIQCL